MVPVNIEKTELLKIVRANLKRHVEQYNEAVLDYKNLVLKISQANLEIAQSGDIEKFKNIKSLPPAPVSSVDSYERALRMLGLSVDDNIELPEDVFNQLVLDEWTWKRSFVTAATSYKSFT